MTPRTTKPSGRSTLLWVLSGLCLGGLPLAAAVVVLDLVPLVAVVLLAMVPIGLLPAAYGWHRWLTRYPRAHAEHPPPDTLVISGPLGKAFASLLLFGATRVLVDVASASTKTNSLVFFTLAGCAALCASLLGILALADAWRVRDRLTEDVQRLESVRSFWEALRGYPDRWRPAPTPRPVPRSHWAVLLLLAIGCLAHQLVFSWWYIEDAAISFAYARNLASGEGLVTYPGGERVEGYSNPLWVALLAVGELIGVNSFTSSKVMQGVLGPATIPLVYAIGREAMPRRNDAALLLPPVLLAVSAQFAIWGASGLENALFSFLFALGLWLVLREGRRGGLPLSAFPWMGLAVTRPEGIMYAAFAGFWGMCLSIERLGSAIQRGRPRLGATLYTPLWLLFFFTPFLTYHWFRYQYFAWELPNTYYAKLGSRNTYRPMSWGGRGWRQLREWSHELWHAYYLPAYLAGTIGLRGWRSWVTGALLIILVLTMAFPALDTLKGDFDLPLWWSRGRAPSWWNEIRIFVLIGTAASMALLTIGRSGWRARVLCWVLVCAALFFHVRANGDWMKGFRWMAMLQVPAAVLLGAGIASIADAVHRALGRLERSTLTLWLFALLPLAAGIVAARITWSEVRFPVFVATCFVPAMLALSALLGSYSHRLGETRRWGILGFGMAAALTSVFAIPNVTHSEWFTRRPETGPEKVHRRVRYMNFVRDRLHLDEPVVNLDVDQGAHMWWSGHQMLDLAGLVDVPQGHHKNEVAFIREYVFTERKPHFAHVHGAWANTTKVDRQPEWKRDYIEVPPYPTGKRSVHHGNHIRRDLLMAPVWSGTPERQVSFADGVTLEGFETAGTHAAPGTSVFLEVGLRSRPRTEDEDFRVLAFLASDTSLHSWELPTGYDYLAPDRWDEEVWSGRFSLPIPEGLPLGTYELGFVILDGQGGVLAAEPTDGILLENPRLAHGEARFADALQLVSESDIAALSEEDVQASSTSATAGDCEDAERLWQRARRRMTQRSGPRAHRRRIETSLAACWTARAVEASDRATSVQALVRARRWDHNHPALLTTAAPLADTLISEGLTARENGEWETAYARFTEALSIDPTRSWARRWAEEMRDYRLGIDATQVAQEKAERKIRSQRARAKHEIDRTHRLLTPKELKGKLAIPSEAGGEEQ